MPVFSLIRKRRSVRSFLKKEIPNPFIKKILEAARWAPSGLNNQPWRFVIVKNPNLKSKISSFTKYSHTIKKANCAIFVFLDKKNSYSQIKDALAIGASIQNLLLAASELDISTCWLGEILNKKKEVNKSLNISRRYDLMALVALGYSRKKSKSSRIPLKKLILKEFL